MLSSSDPIAHIQHIRALTGEISRQRFRFVDRAFKRPKMLHRYKTSVSQPHVQMHGLEGFQRPQVSTLERLVFDPTVPRSESCGGHGSSA